MKIYDVISAIPLKIHPSFHFFVYKTLVDFNIGKLIQDPVLRFIISCVKESSVVIDVGANMGTYAYSISKKIGKNGKVYAFEANPRTARQLKKNIKQNNIFVENLALSSEKGERVFYMHTKGTGPTSSLEYFENIDSEGDLEKTVIYCERLDSYCNDKKIIPTLIKIDVEGHEYHVIQGALETIKKYKPIIIFEFIEQWWIEKKIKDIFEMLSKDYYLMRIEDGKDATEVYKDFRIDEDIDFRLSRNVNIGCLPKE